MCRGDGTNPWEESETKSKREVMYTAAVAVHCARDAWLGNRRSELTSFHAAPSYVERRL